MPVTERLSIEMEKPEWLIQMETDQTGAGALSMSYAGRVLAKWPNHPRRSSSDRARG